MWSGTQVSVAHTWAEALDYMRAPSNAWTGSKGDRVSHRPRKPGDDYYTLDTFDDALGAMERGWEPGRERVAGAMEAAVAGVRHERIPAHRLDVAGSRPFIPAAVAGDPRCMWQRRPQVAVSRPVIEVLASFGAPWFIAPDTLARRGAAILAWIDALEASGWTTSLVMFNRPVSSDDKNAWLDYRVTVKEPGERFDVDRLSYALVCGDFLRRTEFAVLEGCRDLEKTHRSNYGVSKDAPESDRQGKVYFGPCDKAEPWSTTESALANVRAAIMAARPEALACG